MSIPSFPRKSDHVRKPSEAQRIEHDVSSEESRIGTQGPADTRHDGSSRTKNKKLRFTQRHLPKWQQQSSAQERLLQSLKPVLSTSFKEEPQLFHEALSRVLLDLQWRAKKKDANLHDEELLDLLTQTLHGRDWVHFCRHALQEG